MTKLKPDLRTKVFCNKCGILMGYIETHTTPCSGECSEFEPLDTLEMEGFMTFKIIELGIEYDCDYCPICAKELVKVLKPFKITGKWKDGVWTNEDE